MRLRLSGKRSAEPAYSFLEFLDLIRIIGLSEHGRSDAVMNAPAVTLFRRERIAPTPKEEQKHD